MTEKPLVLRKPIRFDGVVLPRVLRHFAPRGTPKPTALAAALRLAASAHLAIAASHWR